MRTDVICMIRWTSTTLAHIAAPNSLVSDHHLITRQKNGMFSSLPNVTWSSKETPSHPCIIFIVWHNGQYTSKALQTSTRVSSDFFLTEFESLFLGSLAFYYAMFSHTWQRNWPGSDVLNKKNDAYWKKNSKFSVLYRNVFIVLSCLWSFSEIF